MHTFVLSTSMGLEKIAKKEVEKQGGNILSVHDRLITFSGDMHTMARVNLWSRVGNRVYMQLAYRENVTDFDTLYDTIHAINWNNVYQEGYQIVLKSSSQKSELSSAPAIQKISKKAIVNHLTKDSGEFLYEDDSRPTLNILVLFIGNTLRVLLDTSGNPLHMRGYRTEAGEAPIKENLAAGMVILSGWKYKQPLYDPFCGSGTIGIEAAMLAKNIAPGLHRGFTCVELGMISGDDMNVLREEARKKQYEGKYDIHLSDIDSDMIDLVNENAQRAKVEDMISVEQKDFYDLVDTSDIRGTLVSNPPYGERLEVDDIERLYKNIDKFFRVHPDCGGGVITSYESFDGLIDLKKYKKRKLYNGGEKCYFYGRV
ncbi:class I SAM-dependent RNA methyltransferase [Candidatus Gracilibacteria bacterium]|nr:class I SAM-dependent RNA methyltransferase [Candidatus Gracilibacteria bacterium]